MDIEHLNVWLKCKCLLKLWRYISGYLCGNTFMAGVAGFNRLSCRNNPALELWITFYMWGIVRNKEVVSGGLCKMCAYKSGAYSLVNSFCVGSYYFVSE